MPPGSGAWRSGTLHGLVDRIAMAFEDRFPRAPVPWRPGEDRPLDPSGPLLPMPPTRRFPAGGARRGVAVLVPPWKIRSTALLLPWTRTLAGIGLETWIPVPPFHLERTPTGQRGGEGMIGPDLAATRAALDTAVREVRACLAAAAGSGGTVALVGLSLGALVAAWALGGPERVDAAALVAPPADLLAVFRGTAIGRRYAALAERAGAPLPEPDVLGRHLAGLVPLDRRPAAPVLVVGGRQDAIALDGAAVLARAWGAPLREHARGHLTLLLACAAARREVARFLGDACGAASPATSSRSAARP